MTRKSNNNKREAQLKKHLGSKGIAVFVDTYKKYHEGIDGGEWVDLETFDSGEEFFDFCVNVLHNDEKSPELMFADYNFIEHSAFGECGDLYLAKLLIEFVKYDEDDRQKIVEYLEYHSCGVCEESLDDILDKCLYCGDFMEYANEMAEDMLDCYNVPDEIRCYFDYDKFAHRLEMDCFVTDNFVFSVY